MQIANTHRIQMNPDVERPHQWTAAARAPQAEPMINRRTAIQAVFFLKNDDF